jgi:Flp pilus assembly protein TadD
MKRAALFLSALLISGIGAAAQAGIFHHDAPKPQAGAVSDAVVDTIGRAIDEQRLADGGRMLDQALLGGATDPRLYVLEGRLSLARGQPGDTLSEVAPALSRPETRADALEYEGIALSLLNRSGEALAVLQKAVTENPSAWRAWNALASEYDRLRDWTQSESAYDHALVDSDGAAIVLNNRGFSRLLQGRLDSARDDFVAALEKKPDLTAARVNLRLEMAMKGDYVRATSAGSTEDQAALLNNAGFAAMTHGDYVTAKDLFTRAIEARGSYYARASDNLAIAESLAATQKSAGSATR